MDIKFDCRWSSEVDYNFISDFLKVRSQHNFARNNIDVFYNKYIYNIYGNSVLVVSYVGSTPIGTRGLWRNDIGSLISYQPVDTLVKSDYRGLGIFKKMTQMSIKKIENGYLIYNFPNKNSYLGYIKMGWKLIKQYRLKVLSSISEYKREHPVPIDDRYANWWLINYPEKLFVKKYGNFYLLLRKLNKPLCYKVIGEISQDMAEKFHEVLYCIMFYRSSYVTWYNKQRYPLNVVALNCNDNIFIPPWKIDAI